jgi:L-2-hydroxycarboxylate dehydrogenase (NAD+)
MAESDTLIDMPRVQHERLLAFGIQVLERLEVPAEDAATTAEVLLSADLRGVDSHGFARFPRYVNGLRNGVMVPRAVMRIVTETAATAALDAENALGQVAGKRGMELAIQKAGAAGVGFVTVRNSNHYGIAGYYAMMALPHDMIGLSMTNSAPLVVPTFGRKAIFGTNPIAIAVPAGKGRPWVLDMATSVVPRGKLEVYNRLGKAMPLGWATDVSGEPTTDAAAALQSMNAREGFGGLLPLGGAGELHSGYKGYGLAMFVEILCGALAGAAFSPLTYPTGPHGEEQPSRVGHFFGAFRIDAFRPLFDFEADMDSLIRLVKDSPRTEGQNRIYVAGEKEYEKEAERRRDGIPLHPKVIAAMKQIGDSLNVPWLGI